MSDPRESPLTPHGRVRRDAMLVELTARMRRTHCARRFRRRTMNAALLVVGVLTVTRMGLLPHVRDSRSPELARHPAPGMSTISGGPTSKPDSVRVTRIESDPSIVARWAARPLGRAAIIDDQTLVAILVALDRPAGIIRAAGQARLTAFVTDEALGRLR